MSPAITIIILSLNAVGLDLSAFCACVCIYPEDPQDNEITALSELDCAKTVDVYANHLTGIITFFYV